MSGLSGHTHGRSARVPPKSQEMCCVARSQGITSRLHSTCALMSDVRCTSEICMLGQRACMSPNIHISCQTIKAAQNATESPCLMMSELSLPYRKSASTAAPYLGTLAMPLHSVMLSLLESHKYVVAYKSSAVHRSIVGCSFGTH